ncbi:helix-turn-helix domain-containing protein [Fredinandcohnia humi]
MNTAEFARKLGVSQKTVRKWIKHLHIPCQKNEYGHYVFDENDLPFYEEIGKQVKSGIPTDKIDIKSLQPRKGKVRKMVQATDTIIEDKLTVIMERLRRNEKRIEEKASEVVTYQLLQHRQEIDELQQKVRYLEEYIQKLENEKRESIQEQPIVLETVKQPRKRKKLIGFLF